MFINEMAGESLVALEVKNKEGKEVILETQVVSSFEAGDYKMVLVEALRHNGQILAFNSVMCTAYITNAEDGKMYKYRLQGIAKREQEGITYHCLISNEDAAEENRRGAKRFKLGAKANIQLLGGGSGTLRAMLNDMSATGISFRMAEAKLMIGDMVSVSFEHDITGAQLKVVAQIVRTQELEKGVLFGCVVKKHDAKYNMLISYLMRQECKVRG